MKIIFKKYNKYPTYVLNSMTYSQYDLSFKKPLYNQKEFYMLKYLTYAKN